MTLSIHVQCMIFIYYNVPNDIRISVKQLVTVVYANKCHVGKDVHNRTRR